MAESEIPVDLENPGQIFASLGLMEAADILLGGAMAGFDWEDGAAEARFRLTALGDEDPVQHVLRFLAEAEVMTEAPAGSANTTSKWQIETRECAAGAPFPFPDPASPATLPAVLRDQEGRTLVINYWGDTTRRDNVKFWAGSGGYPGAALLRDALKLIRDDAVQHVRDPFAVSRPQSSSFRFDWRRDYVPLDAGFSPNDHGSVAMMGYPLVESCAVVGLSHARPLRHEKLHYSYGVMGGGLLDPIFLRAALGSRTSPLPGAPFRRFALLLGWPGQEGQARCITDVYEITDRENRR